MRPRKTMITTEPTIDRSFDQTAQHEHLDGRICPICKLPDCEEDPAAAIPPPADRRHVSPAVLEMQLIELSNAMTAMSKRAIAAEDENKVLKARIVQFEAMTANLAHELDENKFTLEHFTGKDGPNV